MNARFPVRPLRQGLYFRASAGHRPFPGASHAWADGPAVFAEDSRYARDRQATEGFASFDLPGAAAAGEVAQEMADEALLHKTDRLQGRLSQARASVAPIDVENAQPGSYRGPQPVLDDAFAQRALDHLTTDDPKKATLAELEAVGVAMSLGSSGVAQLASEAAEIVDKAKTHLKAMGLV